MWPHDGRLLSSGTDNSPDDQAQCHRVSNALDAGTIWINQYNILHNVRLLRFYGLSFFSWGCIEPVLVTRATPISVWPVCYLEGSERVSALKTLLSRLLVLMLSCLLS